MIQWFKVRFEILRLTLRNRALLSLLGVLLLAPILLAMAFPSQPSFWIPWYGWVIGGTLFLWVAALEYTLKRKEVFDQTSSAFFKAYLDHLIREGHHLFKSSETKDFYLKIGEWQRKAVQGIAIGLGPEASSHLFQAMDTQNPLSEAYTESLNLRSNEPLCKTLHANLEELEKIRTEVANPPELEGDEPQAPVQRPMQGELKQTVGPK